MSRQQQNRAHRRRSDRWHAGASDRLERAGATPSSSTIVEGLPQGKTLDIAQSGPVEGFDAKVQWETKFLRRHRGRLFVIVTAGVPAQARHEPRRPSRHQPKVMSAVGEGSRAHAPRTPSLSASPIRWTPMVWALRQFLRPAAPTRWSAMAGVWIARASAISSRGAEPFRLRMCQPSCSAAMAIPWFRCRASPPLRASHCPSSSRWVGISQTRLDQLTQRTRDGGAEDRGPLEDRFAFYCAGILGHPPWRNPIARQEARCCLCAAYVDGKYGLKGSVCGVPVVDRRRPARNALWNSLSPRRARAIRQIRGIR